MGVAAAAAVAVVAAAVNANETRQQGKRVERAQEDKADVERAIQQESASRERRKQVRRGLVARGQIRNVSAVVGGQGGTAAEQSAAVTQTQSAANIGDVNTAVASSNAITSAETDIFKAGQTTSTQLAAGVVQQGASIFV